MLHGVLQRETTLSLMSCQCASTAGTTPGPPGHLHSRSLHTGSSTSQACMSVFSSTFCCHSIARLVEINSSTTQAYPARVFNYSTQPSNRRRPTAPQHSPCIALQRIYALDCMAASAWLLPIAAVWPGHPGPPYTCFRVLLLQKAINRTLAVTQFYRVYSY